MFRKNNINIGIGLGILVPLIVLMSWATIPTALNSLFGELLKAFGKFEISLFVQNGFSFIFGALGLLLGWLLIENISALQAIFIFITTLWLTLILAIYFFNVFCVLVLTRNES